MPSIRVPYSDVCITMTSPFDDREDHDVASASSPVGYGDAAAFTREYKRLFGAPLARDAERLAGSREGKRQPLSRVEACDRSARLAAGTAVPSLTNDSPQVMR
jgi:hypothetical protein